MPKKAGKAIVMQSLKSIQNNVFKFLAIEPGMRVAIVSDDDEDGVTSAVQMRLFLEMSGCEAKTYFYNHNVNSGAFQNDFLKTPFDRTIFLDLNESFVCDLLDMVGTHTGPFVILDHHPPMDIVHNKFDFLKIKPWDFSKIPASQYPTAKMVFDIFGGIDWICAIGVIGDTAMKEWSSFLKEVQKKHSLSETELEELAGIVGCIVSYHSDKTPDIFEFLCSTRHPKELTTSWFSGLKKEFDELLKQERDKFFKDATFIEDADVYFYETRANVQSKLSNIVSKELPDKTVVIFEDRGMLMGASLRRQDGKVDCGQIAAFASNGARDGRGGGHVPAAGATFRRTYLSTFKDKVLLYIRTNYKKKKVFGRIVNKKKAKKKK